jgi:death-on-curing protein
MNYLLLEEILILHFNVIEDFGGSHGVRDEARIKSVVEVPKQEAFGTEQYPSVCEKAAVYMRNIIGDHPFSDGNKRTGTVVAGVFLMRNGLMLNVSNKELEDFAVCVAVEHLEVAEITKWLESNSKKV